MSRLSFTSLESSNLAKSLPPPPGFLQSAAFFQGRRTSISTPSAAHQKLKEKRAWDLAISPLKQLPMQAIMLYMSGGGVQIFSIGIVFMLLVNPFKAVSTINQSFAQFAPDQSNALSLQSLWLQKIAYILANIVTISLGLWKCQQMGLIPMGTGDWLAFETRGSPPEVAFL